MVRTQLILAALACFFWACSTSPEGNAPPAPVDVGETDTTADSDAAEVPASDVGRHDASADLDAASFDASTDAPGDDTGDGGVDTTIDAAPPDADDAGGVDAGAPGPPIRVWAPGADRVHVFGAFNDWSRESLALTPVGDGSFYGRLDGALDGDEYRLLVRVDGSELERLDPDALAFAPGFDNSRVETVAPAAPFDRPDLRDLVIYELHVGTFHAPDGRVGSFDDVIARLDHLDALGINAIQLMPISEFPGERSWGYNPSLPRAIESAYGGPDGLVRLVAAAHERGIGVIVDVVYNHLAPDNALCDFDAADDDGRCGGSWFYDDERGDTPWGPRPAYDDDHVRWWLAETATQQIDLWGVDGLRWDSTSNIRALDHGRGEALPGGEALLREANAALAERGAWSIAEDLAGDPRVTRAVSDGGFGFGAEWDAGFHDVLRRSLLNEAPVDELARVIVGDGLADPGARVIYAESHDTTGRLNANLRSPHNVRLPDDIWPDDPTGTDAQRRALLAGVVLMCSPGVPMLLQGEELHATGWFHDDRPLDWSLVQTHGAALRAWSTLVSLRTGDTPVGHALRRGGARAQHVHVDGGALAWSRDDGTTQLVCAANPGGVDYPSYRLGVPTGGPWAVLFHTDDVRFGGVAGAPTRLDAEPVPWDGWAWSVVLPLTSASGAILAPATD